jgi:hypothetical protein
MIVLKITFDFQTKDNYNCPKCNKDFSNAEAILHLGAYHKYVEQLNGNSIEDLSGLLESFIR